MRLVQSARVRYGQVFVATVALACTPLAGGCSEVNLDPKNFRCVDETCAIGDAGTFSSEPRSPLVCSREILEFGARPIGRSSYLRVTCENTGAEPLQLSALTWEGGVDTRLQAEALVGGAAVELPLTVAAEGSFALEFVYAPTGDERRDSAVTLELADGDVSTEIVVTGIGLGVLECGAVHAIDADCDGAITALDCDDADPALGAESEDQDCDGAVAIHDCDDLNPVAWSATDDADCDGVSTEADCDDADAAVGAIAGDQDCDGIPAAADCRDTDPNSTTRSVDADCDGTLAGLDCDDGDPWHAAYTADGTECALIVGGTVSGLTAGEVTLEVNSERPIAVGPGAIFRWPFEAGQTFDVSVASQPAAPLHVCSVANGTGTFGALDYRDVAVRCTPTTFGVAGTVSGLGAGRSVKLNLNGVDQTISANGAFGFGNVVDDGASYVVTVTEQPSDPEQLCAVMHGTGTVAGANIEDLEIVCRTSAYRLGGTVEGLAPMESFTLTDGDGEPLMVGENGSFALPGLVENCTAYNVTIDDANLLSGRECRIAGASGVMPVMAVDTITVVCGEIEYSLNVAVSGLIAGQVLAVSDAGLDGASITEDGTTRLVGRGLGAAYAH